MHSRTPWPGVGAIVRARASGAAGPGCWRRRFPLALAFAALWCPPQALRGDALVAWLAGALLLFVSAQTAFHVPHLALAAELTTDVQDRNRAFAGRMAWSLAGVLLAAGALGVLERTTDPRAAAAWIALAAGVATAALCALAAWRVREPAGHMGRRRVALARVR